MRIKSYSIEKLFNTFSYTFSFEERGDVIVVTGPNGYGKTTSLRILHELARKNYYFFYQLPFDEIDVEFENDQYLMVTSAKIQLPVVKANEDVQITDKKVVRFMWAKKNGDILGMFELGESEVALLRMLQYQQQGKDAEIESLGDYLEDNVSTYDKAFEKKDKYAQFKVYIEQLSVLYIPSDRIVDRENMDGSAVIEIAESLSHIMLSYKRKYLQSVARSRMQMIDTLLGHPQALLEEEYNASREVLLPLVKNLHEWGLIDFNTIKEFKKEDDVVLSMYLRELKATLNEYSALYNKIQLFESLIKAKDFTNKLICIRLQKGIEARLNNGEELDLYKLSSGEQNEIILLYKLIFETTRERLVLIDEPELSLHLAWIRGMLNDYKRIADITNCQYLIATHSAAFISGEWDLTYDLFENDKESGDE